jgi:thiol:disulfide interchange protein DsbD
MTSSRIELKRLLLFLLLLAGTVSAHALDPGALLPEQEAFKLDVTVKDPQTLRAQWDIAEGYYLYRERFKFSTNTTGVMLQPASFPPGKIKTDKFFGATETYRHQVAIDIPIKRTHVGAPSLNLTVVSQGCADLGVCYPPLTQTLTVKLPALDTSDELVADSSGAISGFFNKLGGTISDRLGLSNSGRTFLEPEQAYQATFSMDGNTLIARWDIAEGYYLYRDKLSFRVLAPSGVSFGSAEFPSGETKTDEFFGTVEVYHEQVVIKVPVLTTGAASTPGKLTLEAHYQGCAEAGFCYPPLTRTAEITLPAPSNASGPDSADDRLVSAQDRIARGLLGDSLLLTVLKFFVFGLALAFTPCVFPMIPILSSIIVGQGAQQGTRRAFTLSLVYVLAVAFTYTVLGVIAGLSGKNFQAVAQAPWVIITFSTIFVLLALSMFGLYQLQLPTRWQSKLAGLSNQQRGGTWMGVAIMGFLSALIVGPCVAAPLAGALIVIAQTGDAMLGGVALFALSMGMGVPLLAVGTSLGKWLPRAGGWMDSVKIVFGVLLLGVALWLLERILPPSATLLLWAGLFILSAVYLGALERLVTGASGWDKLRKGLGWVALIYGGLLLVGAASGGKDLLRPLAGLTAQGAREIAPHALAFKRIKSVAELEREIATARSQGKPAMLDYYADWCVACKEFEKYTFSTPQVQKALAGTVLLQADITAYDAEDEALVKHFQLVGPPAILFFGPDGQERKPYRVIGFMNAEDFRAHVDKALR